MSELLKRSVITEKIVKKFNVFVFGANDEVVGMCDVYSPESMSGCAMCCPWNGHAYKVYSNELSETAVHGKIRAKDTLFFYQK
jgi:hypothetical protein